MSNFLMQSQFYLNIQKKKKNRATNCLYFGLDFSKNTKKNLTDKKNKKK